jgi:tetratricopeptide (TPR) repeat protein
MTTEADQESFAAISLAVGAVSAVCDYARENDGRGFNSADAWLGHTLAAMPVGLWTNDAALAAWDMLRKYRGQLAAAGIEYDELPRPDGAGQLEAEQREQAAEMRAQARENARERARSWRDQQYRKSRSYVRCDGDGEQVVLAFAYDPDLVAASRKIEGRVYDGATKTNRYPFTSLPDVIKFAETNEIDVTPDVRALAAIAMDRAVEAAARPQVRLDDDGSIIIDASLDYEVYQALKRINNDQPTVDRRSGVHRVPVYLAAELLTLAEDAGLRVSDEARAKIQEESGRQGQNQADASAFEAEPVSVPGLAPGLSLKPQQYPVVRFALKHRRVLVGDDMGWGKTLSSLAAAAADGAYPAVVVCRPSLTLNWVAEISRFFPGLKIYEASGTTPQPVPADTDVIVIGSAALAAKPSKTKNGGKEFGWVAELARISPKALIVDEGQDTKERTANRSQACEQLAAQVIARDGLVLDLTGTAILNRPRELCQQLTMLGRLDEFGGEKRFLWRYCLAETNRWGANYNGARNLIELSERLRRWGIMIRRSDDAALGLPPCREHVLIVPQSDLNPDAMAKYRAAENDLLEFLAKKAREAAERLGEDPNSAAVEATMRAAAAEHLVAINTLRQLAGQAKRDYVTRWVRSHVDAGEKVMVAAHHRGEVDAYAAEFGGLRLQGGQSVLEKEKAKAAFQQKPAAEAPVISVAIGAGGVGHTLTAARIGIQAEQAWTPGETQQMKKRLHRIGQNRPVDYYITVAESTIDEQLRVVVTSKQSTLDAVLDGRSDTGTDDSETSVVADLTWRLTQQGLGNPAEGGAPNGGEPAEAVAVAQTGQDRPAAARRADQGGDDSADPAAQLSPLRMREFAHRYLDDGLMPVPGWGARPSGECCCPRGASCSRPGKHPRAVSSEPGSDRYSWKPLVCATHEDVDERFADGSEYATGNLMVAIPAGLMAVDIDYDDGGRDAAAALATELGELPLTLAHKTPHGEHRVYRTPPGWTGRAWVGKDPANPVPAGIDLRMPGQILMAAPSRVPSPNGAAAYGPVTGDAVAALPAAYVAAWTPPQAQARPTAAPVPVPPDRARRSAKYVHDAMTRIVDDLADHKPGGRNAAAYAAGLKAGSLLAAARITPGAEATAWTDERAEQALLDAAHRNGYIDKDGEADALRAIRSGLRNGARQPRSLPDFTVHRSTPGLPPRRPPAAGRRSGQAPSRPRRWQDLVPDDVRREVEAADQNAAARRRAAVTAHQQAIEQHDRGATAETAAQVERTRTEANAAHQEYTRDGRHITGRHDAAMLRWAATITAQREQPAPEPAPGFAEDARKRADIAAGAANRAYQAGNLDEAQEHAEQAAAADPSRPGLWQQYRDQITARRAVLAARQAYQETGARQQAEQVLEQVRHIDPRTRGRALWDTALPVPATPQRQRHAEQNDPAKLRVRQTASPQAKPQRAQAVAQTWPSPSARREPSTPAAERADPPDQDADSPHDLQVTGHAVAGIPDARRSSPSPWPSADDSIGHEPEPGAPGPQSSRQPGAVPPEAAGAGVDVTLLQGQHFGTRDPDIEIEPEIP